jgi:putative tricarboxylic transport membrane protein
MHARRGDLLLGIVAMALAATYLLAAGTIPESLLSDAVGAAGVPKLAGWAMGIAGALLCLRSIRRGSVHGATPPIRWRRHLLALGLFGLLVAYVILAPVVGYPLSIALLTGVVAWYAGARFGWRLCAIAIASGAMFWVLFAQVFGVPMPRGLLFGG